MKKKKCLPIIFAALLTVLMVSVLVGCASPKNRNRQKPSSKQNNAVTQNNAAVQSSELVIDQNATSTNEALRPTDASNASAAYEKLIAYKTGDYGQQSIADFHAALASTPDELTEFLAAISDVISNISPDDENYDFFATTMSFSSHELYCEHMGEELTFFIAISKESRLCDYLDEEGSPVYEFTCFVELQVPYTIISPKLVSVAERDKILLTFQEEIQDYLNGLNEAEIVNGNIEKMLTDKSVELANSLSTESMKLSPCEIYLLEINDAGTEIIRQ